MTVNKGNVFSAEKLTEYMLSSLPEDSSSALNNPYDAVALLSHACMIAVGFRLIGLGEDYTLEAPPDSGESKPLPREWNISTSANYAFRYAHSQSSLQYVIKISRLGSKIVVNCVGIGDDKVHTLQVAVKDFLSESSFPFTMSEGDGSESSRRKLQNLFISAGRVTDLGNLMKIQIIQKVAPGLHKEGYEESAHAASTADTHQQRQSPLHRTDPSPAHDILRDDRMPPHAQPRPFNDPLASAPRRPYPAGDFPPPGFEDEYEINRPAGVAGPERRPLNIGERDLYPPGLGPHDPLRGGDFGPRGGIGGGGMHPTFEDPLFGGREAGNYNGR
ncbi:MAG: hypothetical protein LQ351_002577 [Letrouitia transgressa]|nr:MAG: hypothetical protein LQ351_002577 [Letrouitia transgressa]